MTEKVMKIITAFAGAFLAVAFIMNGFVWLYEGVLLDILSPGGPRLFWVIWSLVCGALAGIAWIYPPIVRVKQEQKDGLDIMREDRERLVKYIEGLRDLDPERFKHLYAGELLEVISNGPDKP